MQVAIFECLDSNGTFDAKLGAKYAVRADNIVSMTLARCNTGCTDSAHWIVETKGLGGVPKKFEAKLRSIG